MKKMAKSIMEQKRSTDPKRGLFSLSSAPSSPSSASSASDFEFTISLSPTSKKPSHLCPADELFYKGQLLPLHISPRLDMVRTLLTSSSYSSSSDSATTGSRDSTGSSNDSSSSFTCSDILLLNDCDSSRPSSATDDDDFKKPPPPSSSASAHAHAHASAHASAHGSAHSHAAHHAKKSKYFSLFSSVFLRGRDKSSASASASPGKKIGSSAKEVIKKCVKKVKPLYGRLSHKNATVVFVKPTAETVASRDYHGRGGATAPIEEVRGCYRHSSFSGNLNPRYPRQGRGFPVSCPSSMRSSPSHSGVLRPGLYTDPSFNSNSSSSSMEELQSAIQGAIAHCKNSMAQGTPKK